METTRWQSVTGSGYGITCISACINVSREHPTVGHIMCAGTFNSVRLLQLVDSVSVNLSSEMATTSSEIHFPCVGRHLWYSSLNHVPSNGSKN